jgi:hypothetical protein
LKPGARALPELGCHFRQVASFDWAICHDAEAMQERSSRLGMRWRGVGDALWWCQIVFFFQPQPLTWPEGRCGAGGHVAGGDRATPLPAVWAEALPLVAQARFGPLEAI